MKKPFARGSPTTVQGSAARRLSVGPPRAYVMMIGLNVILPSRVIL